MRFKWVPEPPDSVEQMSDDSLMTLVQNEDEVHADAWVEESYGAPGNRLYINRGIGMSILPLRILAQPELTFFQLEQAEGEGLAPPRAVE